MKFARRLFASVCAIAVVCWETATLLAQDAATASGDKASWAFGYILVGLFIALGLMAVCRPGSRSSEIKREAEEE